MSKIQIGKRSTKATEFIEGNNIFMNSEGNFVAGEFIETGTPNISKLYKTDKHFETFEIIENSDPVQPPVMLSVTASSYADIIRDFEGNFYTDWNSIRVTQNNNTYKPTAVNIPSEYYDTFSDGVSVSEEKEILQSLGLDTESGDVVILNNGNDKILSICDGQAAISYQLVGNTFNVVDMWDFSNVTYSLALPEGVETINYSNYNDEAIDGLRRLTLPSTIQSDGGLIFYAHSHNLERVDSYIADPSYLSMPYGEATPLEELNTVLHVPTSLLSTYQTAAAEQWNWSSELIQSNIVGDL